MKCFISIICFQNFLALSQEKADIISIYKEILYSVNNTYKSKESLPDSIRKLIPRELILFDDKKALRKTKKASNYKQIFLIAGFHDFFLVNCRHYETGSHDHVLIFNYKGKLILDLISGYNQDGSFELLQRQLVKRGKFENPTCGQDL